MVEPGARSDTTERPEATRSGLNQPSTAVGPTEENVVIVSSDDEAVPWSSRAPTVTTRGSSPGEVIDPLVGPKFPAEATTTMPDRHAASAAWSSGLRTDDGNGTVPIEM